MMIMAPVKRLGLIVFAVAFFGANLLAGAMPASRAGKCCAGHTAPMVACCTAGGGQTALPSPRIGSSEAPKKSGPFLVASTLSLEQEKGPVGLFVSHVFPEGDPPSLFLIHSSFLI